MNGNQFFTLVDGIVDFFKNAGSTAKEIYSSFKDEKSESSISNGKMSFFILPILGILGLILLFRR